ncbi:MAG: hypothetical protein DHS20C18_51010 [Saprospiraceae bacterium]|nr:MAG: hypothetical protein DHS20C18_51010 [Saprospiraceae bacterium]
MRTARLAILDMYDNTPNQGMRCIKDIVDQFAKDIEWTVFDTRGKVEIPDLNHDIFICTGGPGSPMDGDGIWDARFYDWINQVWNWNLNPENPRKFVFFICHSFQMACLHFKLGKISKRKSMSFGTFITHMTDAGVGEELFQGLPNPFYIADFRNWQVLQPDEARFDQMGANILALEKIRPHVPLERAIMAIRFSPEIFGTQFHPEADPDGMLEHFQSEERREMVLSEHGAAKYRRMIDHLSDPDKISLTHNAILPGFLNQALGVLKREVVLV